MQFTSFMLVRTPNFGLLIALVAVLLLIFAIISKAITRKPKEKYIPPKFVPKPPVVIPQPMQNATTQPIAPAQKNVSNAATGECDLYGVSYETAAMIMAIVADGLGEPLEALRFISIKEI